MPSNIVLRTTVFSSLLRRLLAIFRNLLWVFTPIDPARWRWFKRAWRGSEETYQQKYERWVREEIAAAQKRAAS